MGYGLEVFPNGNYYIGDYINNRPEGEGLFKWVTGEKYKGNWS